MISQLKGQAVGSGVQELYVDIGMMVLKVWVPDPSCYRLHQPIVLHTELIWKETGPMLYGFESLSDIALFHELLKIQSVGPRLALSVLSYPRDLFLKACQTQNALEICNISGVGKKTAQRIISELDLSKVALAPMSYESSIKSQARLALLNLGFLDRQIDEVLMEYQGVSLDTCLKESLLKLGERRAATARQRPRTQTETS
jgi:Holliday junction DNA helicase RuvA